MKGTKNPNPPRIMLQVFRWFCHPDFQEEIEGDLLEQFQLNVEEYGLNQAKWHFVLDVLLLFRPEIMGNFYQLTFYPFQQMYTSHWLKLIGLNLLFVAILLMRFVPGPPNKVVVGLSNLCMVSMILGIILSPISLSWSIVELKKYKQLASSYDHWSTGYRFALIALVITGVFLALALFFSFSVKAYFILPALMVITVVAIYSWPKIKSLRQTSLKKLNPAPFFMLTLPLVILLAHAYLVVPISAYSRAYAIKKTEPLIRALENYKTKEGHYPEAITDLQPVYLPKIPRPGIMGSEQFWYEKTADTYSLSFQQHLGATEEWVVYNNANQYHHKGYFASFETKVPKWRYYWFD